MNVEDLLFKLEWRAEDRRRPVVVETRVDRYTEVDSIERKNGLIILGLWKPGRDRRP